MAADSPQLLVHNSKDTSGVVVVEGLKSCTNMLCSSRRMTRASIYWRFRTFPLVTKVALRDIRNGDTVIKYGEDIGVAKADIRRGEHIHVHNLRTKRW